VTAVIDTNDGGAARAGQVAYLLGQVGSAVEGRFAERLAVLGLSTQHALVLRAVGVGPGRSQVELAQATGLSPSRLVALVDELESMDAVRRERLPADRRRHAVQLTRPGQELIRRVARAAADHGGEVLGDLDPSERELLQHLLGRVRLRAES
jgi:DNA-binding MarR family transcriptional regulator